MFIVALFALDVVMLEIFARPGGLGSRGFLLVGFAAQLRTTSLYSLTDSFHTLLLAQLG
jgi:hypothetical protein